MAAVTKGKYVRSIVAIVLLSSALWGLVLWMHSRDVASAKAAKLERPDILRKGLDLEGGISVVLAPVAGQQVDPGTLEKAVDIIRQRVDALGVAEPEISTQGETILVQIPGVEDQERALDLIGTTAVLRFRPVLEVLAQPTPEERAADKAKAALPNCSDPETYPEDKPDAEVILCAKGDRSSSGVRDPSSWALLRLGPVALEGSAISEALAQFNQASNGNVGGWEVAFELNSDGAKKFGDLTGKLACNPVGDPTRELAIVLDRVVESHPPMGQEVACNTGIADGRASISGGFTEQEAKDLALVLRYGALPIELERLDTTTVSPTLGEESLRSGILAAIIGLAIVFLYVLLFYRALGLIVWVGLGVHAAITFAVVALLGKTAGFALSLAGIAGLIVSLGIAADSFIVYFERIKDEAATGKSVRSAVDRAWPSAWRTIIAADTVTALAALVLYFLAVGNVRGFALMLGISTTLDLVISYLYMHPAVWLLGQTRALRNSRIFVGDRNAKQAAAPVGSGA